MIGEVCLLNSCCNLREYPVILADLEEPAEASEREDWKRYMLVGATRAKALLTIFRKG